MLKQWPLLGAIVLACLGSAPIGYAQTTQTAPAAGAQRPATLAANSAAGTTPATGATPATSSTGSTGTDGASARNIAGTVDLVDGNSHIVSPDKTVRSPKVGDKVYEGDSVVTDSTAEIHIQMADGGFLAVRPNTALAVTKYQANGDATDRSVISLVHGTLRSITGWIGKTFPRNYAISTPDATIGVRGTDHETAYLPDADGDTAAGTYDTVHAGGTTMTTATGRVDVTPDHAGFFGRGGAGGAPHVLAQVPHFFAAPHRNDARMIGMHDRINASYQQRRAARVQEHMNEVRRGGNAAQRGAGASGNAQSRFGPREAAGREAGAHPLLDRLREQAQNRNRQAFTPGQVQRPGAAAAQAPHPVVPAQAQHPAAPVKRENNSHHD